MQIIKLVYIAHGWMLGLFSEELIDDVVEAWRYGPVVPRTYHEFKRFGGYPIEVPVNSRQEELTHTQNSIIDAVHDVYRNVSGSKLSSLTHKKGTPWHDIYHTIGEGAIIPSSVILRYYERVLKGG